MPIIEITYDDKQDRRVFTDIPDNQRVVAADMNEIKNKFNQLSAKVDALKNPSLVTVLPGNFSGNFYQNNLLIGLTAGVHFKLFTNSGSGTMMQEADFVFSSELGRITVDAGDYVLLITKPLA